MEFISQLKMVHGFKSSQEALATGEEAMDNTPVKLSKGSREKRVVVSLGMVGDSH